MFGEYVYDHSPALYSDFILINDSEGLNSRTDYINAFAVHGFEIVEYKDDLSFRIEYEKNLKCGKGKIAVLNEKKAYIPYDILQRLSIYAVSLHTLFPKLNSDVLQHKSIMDLDLLTMVISNNYENLLRREETEQYFDTIVYSKSNLSAYFSERFKTILSKLNAMPSYKEWYRIAEEKALIDRYSIQYGLNIDTQRINVLFQDYVMKFFGTLSTKNDEDTPVLVSRTMEYMHEHSDKFVIVVMDGMSEFDWNIIAESFGGIEYEQSAMFAMIPSTTSISRQCLLSGKFPSQLWEPWIQSKEKAEFTACAKALGYTDSQIGYARGYDAEFNAFVKCGAVIINDVDDLVHAQPQGRLGMYNDISVLANEKKLRHLVERLLSNGFDVYITADHGNTQCTGIGKYVGAGVDIETKSHRMLVLKDFADKGKLKDRFGLVEYPKYYLPKEYEYLICDAGASLDVSGEQVMTHGGMTIDEVVVPFIKIKAEKTNG